MIVSYIYIVYQTKNSFPKGEKSFSTIYGTRDRIRTYDHHLRRVPLYPTELREQKIA